jgi:hypothetical protein
LKGDSQSWRAKAKKLARSRRFALVASEPLRLRRSRCGSLWLGIGFSTAICALAVILTLFAVWQFRRSRYILVRLRAGNLRRATRAGRNRKSEIMQFDDRSDQTQA